jgi:putative PIN family toxin of toxin-antitoxin system
MKVIIDTNVIVSGLLSPYGHSAQILQLLITGKIDICYDARILVEYYEVLKRPKFKLKKEKVAILLREIKLIGESSPSSPLPQSLPDPDDDMFLEVALTCNADCIITGNLKHFPKSLCFGVKVFTPAAFISYFRERSI